MSVLPSASTLPSDICISLSSVGHAEVLNLRLSYLGRLAFEASLIGSRHMGKGVRWLPRVQASQLEVQSQVGLEWAWLSGPAGEQPG